MALIRIGRRHAFETVSWGVQLGAIIAAALISGSLGITAGVALAGAVLRWTLGVVRTELEHRRHVAAQRAALREIVECARRELVDAALLTRPREAYQFTQLDPPVTLRAIAAGFRMVDFESRVGEYWALLAEDLREREAALLSVASVQFVVLGPIAASEVRQLLAAVHSAAVNAAVMERKWSELVWRGSRVALEDPLAHANATRPVADAMRAPYDVFRAAASDIVRRVGELERRQPE